MDESDPPKPGRMIMEVGASQDGGFYRDFVVPSRSVDELFSARLIERSGELVITWTATLGVGVFMNRIKLIRELLNGADAFDTISGLASDELETLLRQRQFNFSHAERLLKRHFGGHWTVKLVEKSSIFPIKYNLVATQIGDSDEQCRG